MSAAGAQAALFMEITACAGTRARVIGLVGFFCGLEAQQYAFLVIYKVNLFLLCSCSGTWNPK